MLKDELFHVLGSDRDDVDTQFHKTLPICVKAATHHALYTRVTMADKPAMALSSSMFWAYYRSVYYANKGYGSVAFVCRNDLALQWLRLLIKAFLGLREVHAEECKASAVCPALRNTRDAFPNSQAVLIYGLPFRDLMSWDIGNLLALSPADGLFVFTSDHPDKWDIRANNKGEVVRMYFNDVLDIQKAVQEFKKL